MGDCARCGAPTSGVSLCATCVTALRIELADVAGIIPAATIDGAGRSRRDTCPSLPEELDTTLARGDHLTGPYARGRASGPLPLVFKAHAGESLWVLHGTLRAWAVTLGWAPTAMGTAQLARWFLDHLDQVQRSPDAAELADEVTYAVHQARRAIDRPSDQRVFLGPCGNRAANYAIDSAARDAPPGLCTEEVYGLPWRDTARCTRCGAEYRVSQRQEWLRERAQRYLGTAPEVAGFLRLTGVECTAEMIRGYKLRKRLEPAGRNQRGHPLYLISDVLLVIRDRYTRRARH